ncbi:MAG: S8 family serine peptidase [Woeseiaceae bacterium]|nr:S8 family serine peptidase [Woeseiaceae bacterium]
MAKSSKKKRATKSGKTAKAPAGLRKLDPALLTGALRAKKERRVKVSRSKTLRMAAAPLSKSLRPGVQSLAANLPSSRAMDFLKDDLVPVIIDSGKPEALDEQIKRWKGDSKQISRTTLCARVPRTRLMDVAGYRGVRYVEASTKLRPHCDLAHRSTGLLPKTTGFNRQVSQTGQGVLVGIVDTGIDVGHSAFRSGGSTRIVNYLDQERNVEFTSAEINAGSASGSVDEIGHGTHVAGIAAGNGAGSPNGEWAGVAPDADLAIVKTTFSSSDIALAVNHIFSVADARSQPCVVNLSLGGHAGGHDGTTVTERAIDQMSGVGKMVVVSAGNEGRDNIHATTILTNEANARWAPDFTINAQVFATDSGPQQFGLAFVQVWSQREDSVDISLRSPNGELFSVANNGDAEFDRGLFFIEATHRRHPYSGDDVTSFTIITVPQDQWLGGWSIVVEKAGTIKVGAVHAWIADGSQGFFIDEASDDYLVGMPGTAFSAITVASYATRKQWPSREPNQSDGTFLLNAMNVDDISYFSSPGPSRDRHNKPEIAAPGQWLLAPLSSDASTAEMPNWLRVPGRAYAALQGTSMSAPYVTGALALLLEKDGNIDWAEAKRRLIKAASQDQYTTAAWNQRWGYGKLSVKRLLTIEP